MQSVWSLVFVAVWNAVAPAGPELPLMTSSGQPAVVSVTPNQTSIGRYEKFELTVELSATYENPFDPEQIDLTAEFVSPQGKRVRVAGFFYQAYRNRHADDDTQRPLLDAIGSPQWKIRFAPTAVGEYQYTVRLENRMGQQRETVGWGPGRFTCTASAHHGFLRVSPVNRRYFQFDDGTPFFAVGQNLQNDWIYYSHYRPLAAAGCNAVRVWTFCHWTWLEWMFKPGIRWAKSGDFLHSNAGLGRYNQRIAWIADQQLQRSERDGLHLMFCLGNATGGGELSPDKGDGFGSWSGNPYNVANGGFLTDPQQFWTDPRARKLYRQRLRYLIARYGYSTGLWAWEFWNELGDARPDVIAWHREMTDYVHATDPNRHLVTTSTWQSADRFSAVWSQAGLDFSQSHCYGSAPTVARVTAQVLHAHPTLPHIVGEGGGPQSGIDPRHGQTKPLVDPENVEFHNCLWAGALSGAAGATLPWWWRDRVEPQNLFYHYTAVARFVAGEPWATLRPAAVAPPHVTCTSGRGYAPVILAPTASTWGEKPRQNQFTVLPDGSLTDIDKFPATLFGSRRPEWSNPPRLTVDYPQAGRFAVRVASASGGMLEVLLDGQSVLRAPLVGNAQHEVKRSLAVDVPAGRHQIELRNAGPHWLRIGHVLLTGYRDRRKFPDIDIYAVQSDRQAYLWLHHRLHTLGYRDEGFTAEPIVGAQATVVGLADGRYRIEWWDTYEGRITRNESRPSRAGHLTLDLPPLRTDLACKIKAA
jgi:hypothetical protein